MTSQEAVDFVSKWQEKEPDAKMSTICEAIFDHCLAPDLDGDGTGCDNMTCIIISFSEGSIPAPEETDAKPTKGEISNVVINSID